jgi:hypothetical protein
MRKYLPLVLLLTLPLPLQASYFNVAVTESRTTDPDTAIITWSGYAQQDSLAVWYDASSYPDADSVGKHLWSLTSPPTTGRETVYQALPSGDYVYFSLFGQLQGAWTRLGTDSVYIAGYGEGFPRIGGYFNIGTWTAALYTAYGDSHSVYNWATDGADECCRYSALPQTERNYYQWKLARDINPNFMSGPHLYMHNFSAYERSKGPNILSADVDSLLAHWDDADYKSLWVAAKTTITNAPGTAGTLIVINSAIVPAPDSYSEIDTHYPMVMKADKSTWEMVRLTSGGGNDSLGVARAPWGQTPVNLASGDSLWYFVNSKETSPVWPYGARIKHPGNGAEAAGKWGAQSPDYLNYPHAQKIRQDLDQFEAQTIVAGELAMDFIMYDVWAWNNANQDYDGTYFSDSSFIWSAMAFETHKDSSRLYMGGNITDVSFNGQEDSLLVMGMLGEGFWVSDKSRFQTIDSSGTNRPWDWMLARVAQGFAKDYRYRMRSDNYPFGYAVHGINATSWNIDNMRMAMALSAIFGRIAYQGTPLVDGTPDTSRWVDENWVDSSGNAVFQAPWDATRAWLGYPIEPWQYLELDTLSAGAEKLVNTTFEDSLAPWVSSNSDSITISSSTDAATGDSAMLMTINVPFRQSQAFYDIFDHYVTYNPATPMTMTADTEYTLEFNVKTADLGYDNYSRFIHLRLRDISATPDSIVWFAPVHVSNVYQRVLLPIKTARYEGALTDVELQIGLTPTYRNDKSTKILIDDVSLKPGIGMVGYSRRFDNGLVVANIRESAITVDIPGPDSTYQKILADSSKAWAKIAHNTGVVINDSLAIGAEEAYFLFKPSDAPIQDIHPHPAPSSITLTSPSPSVIEIVFPQSTEGDCAGYVSRYFEGENNAPGHYQEGFIGDSTAVSDTTHTLTGLTPGTWYSVSIFEFDTLGNYSDTTSN